jgi:hypothetical protein
VVGHYHHDRFKKEFPQEISVCIHVYFENLLSHGAKMPEDVMKKEHDFCLRTETSCVYGGILLLSEMSKVGPACSHQHRPSQQVRRLFTRFSSSLKKIKRRRGNSHQHFSIPIPLTPSVSISIISNTCQSLTSREHRDQETVRCGGNSSMCR